MKLAEGMSDNPLLKHISPSSLVGTGAFLCLWDSLAATTLGVGRAMGREPANLYSNPSLAISWLCELREISTIWMAIAHPLGEKTTLDH